MYLQQIDRHAHTLVSLVLEHCTYSVVHRVHTRHLNTHTDILIDSNRQIDANKLLFLS